MPVMKGNAEQMARALGGARRAGDGWLCRCPVSSHGRGRGDQNPSLFVHQGRSVPVFTCFCGCDRSDVVAEMKRRGLLDGKRRDAALTFSTTSQRAHASAAEPDPQAVAIWKAAQPIGGTLAERYLEDHRGIPAPHPPSLRFVPALRYPPTGRTWPAMVAALQTADRHVIAVQATFIEPATTRKATLDPPRWTFGRHLGTGAVRFGAASDVLGLAEGSESALAAQHLTGIPCWASLGAQRYDKVSIPPTVRTLHLFADDDDAGRKAADRAAHLNRNLTVEIRLPPDGFQDWGDVAMERMSV